MKRIVLAAILLAGACDVVKAEKPTPAAAESAKAIAESEGVLRFDERALRSMSENVVVRLQRTVQMTDAEGYDLANKLEDGLKTALPEVKAKIAEHLVAEFTAEELAAMAAFWASDAAEAMDRKMPAVLTKTDASVTEIGSVIAKKALDEMRAQTPAPPPVTPPQ